MFFSVPHGACDLQAAVCLVARGVNPERWGYVAEQDAWRLICANVREGRLRAYIIRREFGETYEAERSQFAGLADRLYAVSTGDVAIRDLLGRKHSSPFGELFFYEDDLHAALRAESAEKAAQKSAEASKGRGGRPRRYDHDTIEDEVLRLMDHHGDFVAGDKEWDCQARLEEALARFCIEKFGEEPARSTLQAPISSGLAKSRQKKRQGVVDK